MIEYSQCNQDRNKCYSLILIVFQMRLHPDHLMVFLQLQVPLLGTYALLSLCVTSIHRPGTMTGVSLELLRISARRIILLFGTHLLGPLLLVFFPEVL